MPIRLQLLLAILLSCTSVSAQLADSSVLSNATVFKNGLYNSLASLANNSPEVAAGGMRYVKTFHNATTQTVKLLSNDQRVNSEGSKILVFDGKPYYRLPESISSMPAFSLLRIRGRLSVFSYLEDKEKSVRIAAYNPLTGIPFRQGNVIKKYKEEQLVILEWYTGNTYPLTKANILMLTADDPELRLSIAEINATDREKLLKAIQVYDDRNPVYLSLNQ